MDRYSPSHRVRLNLAIFHAVARINRDYSQGWSVFEGCWDDDQARELAEAHAPEDLVGRMTELAAFWDSRARYWADVEVREKDKTTEPRVRKRKKQEGQNS